MKRRTLRQDEKNMLFAYRGCYSDGDGKRHPRRLLVIHHQNGNPEDNRPINLKILTV